MRSLLFAPLFVSSVAAAGPGVTLPSGVLNATLTTEVNASSDVMGSPSSIAPDISYGATDDLTLAIVHSTFATTGFRGGSGAGVCFGDACTRAYNNAGLEGTYAMTRGSIASGLSAGLMATNIENGWVSAKLGAKLRAPVGRVTFASSPSVFVALDDRGAKMNRDRIYLPISALVRIVPALSVGCSTGFKAPLDNVGDAWEVAAGANVQVTLAPQWIAGASWVHGKLFGGDVALPDAASGWDYRALQVWLSVTR